MVKMKDLAHTVRSQMISRLSPPLSQHFTNKSPLKYKLKKEKLGKKITLFDKNSARLELQEYSKIGHFPWELMEI